MKLNSILKIIVLCCLPALTAQEQRKEYLVVNYLQLAPSLSGDDFVAAERLRLRSHRKAANEHLCRGWFLYRVEGAGPGRYVAAELHSSLEVHAKGRPAALSEGLFTAEEVAQMDRADAQRELLRTEIWEISQSAKLRRGAGNPVKLDIQFFDTMKGRDADFLQLEERVTRKTQQARIDDGQAQSWILFRRLTPAGSDVGYDYVTFTGYHEPEANEEFEPTGLSPAEQEALRTAGDVRTRVGRERWVPLMHVLAPKSSK
jgi:hypothetical protein